MSATHLDDPPQPRRRAGRADRERPESAPGHTQSALPDCLSCDGPAGNRIYWLQTQPSVKCSRQALEQPRPNHPGHAPWLPQTPRDSHQHQRPPHTPFRARSTPGAPAITCLPFLDCCMLWLLQDPMGRHRPGATAPSHAGGSREGREEQPSPGTTRRAG